MPQDPPNCPKCGNRHWYFKSCAKSLPVQVVYRPLPEGVREWGDRSHTYHHAGGNVFRLDRPKLVPGEKHTPPPPEAA